MLTTAIRQARKHLNFPSPVNTMKHKSPCRCCGEPVPDLTKCWDTSLGFVCPPCHADLAIAHEVLIEALEPLTPEQP